MSYITITVQLINVSWTTSSYVLATRAVDEKHTAACIIANVNAVLEEFEAWRATNVFVTGDASNMKAAFCQQLWQGCACHNLNLVLSHSFDKSEATQPEVIKSLPDEVTELIETCKQLVTLAKRSNINQLLETTLKQCVITRWNSILTTLKSVCDNLDQLRTLGLDLKANKNLLCLLADVSEPMLVAFIAILEPFDTATKCLSADKSPTSHLVVATRK